MVIEWSLVLFTLIAGAGAGMLVFAGLGEFLGASKKTRFVSGVVALILLIAGGCFSLLHLANPANVMAAASNIFSFSPISLELIFLGLCALIAIVYVVLVNRESLASKILGVCGIVAGLIFCYVSGHGYEVIAVRAAWATPALSVSYLASSLTLGGFFFLLVQVLQKDEAASIKKISLIVLIIALLETVAFALYAATAPLGDAALIMWIGGLVVGGLIAVIAALLLWLKNISAMVYLGAIAALVGGCVFRVVMWMAASPYVPNLFDVAAQSQGLFPF